MFWEICFSNKTTSTPWCPAGVRTGAFLLWVSLIILVNSLWPRAWSWALRRISIEWEWVHTCLQGYVNAHKWNSCDQCLIRVYNHTNCSKSIINDFFYTKYSASCWAWNQRKLGHQMFHKLTASIFQQRGHLANRNGTLNLVFWLKPTVCQCYSPLLSLPLFPLIDTFLSSAISIFKLVTLAFASLGVTSLLGDLCYQYLHPW